MAPGIQAYTLDVITYGFLGDYTTEDIVAEIERLLPALSKSVFSFPRRFPWPLNKVSIFGFRKSMDARKEFQALLAGVLEARRTDLRSAVGADDATKNCGVVDEFLRIQKEQIDAGGPRKGEVFFDDDFIFDNVSDDGGVVCKI